MSTATPAAPPRHRRRWKTALVCLLLIGTASAGYFWYLSSKANRELEVALAETDALDPGWRWEVLVANWPAVPAERNAAAQALRAAAATANDVEGTPALAVLNQLDRLATNVPLGAEPLAAVREYLQGEPKARAAAIRLADLHETGPELLVDEDGTKFQALRKVRLLLSLEAMLRVDDGDADGALDACRGAFQTPRALGVEPPGTGLQWCKQFHPHGVRLVEWSLGQVQPTDEALAELQACLERELAIELRQALRRQRARGWKLLQELRDGKVTYGHLGPRPATARAFLAGHVPINTSGDAADYLRGMNRMIGLTAEPLDGRFEELNAHTKAWQEREPFLTGLVLAVEQAVWEQYWSQTFLRRALVGVAAERYRLKHGGWPAELEALVKEGYLKSAPTDPFTGRPLGWQRDPEGVTISSSRYGSFRVWDPAARQQRE